VTLLFAALAVGALVVLGALVSIVLERIAVAHAQLDLDEQPWHVRVLERDDWGFGEWSE
jgi:hypothetical protein